MPLTGSEYLAQIAADPTGVVRSARALAAMRAGAMPSWFADPASWPTIVSTASIDGKVPTLTMRVAPDVAAVGTDADYARAPLTPSDAQALADFKKSVLPTRKIARLIFQQAARRAPLSDVKSAPTFLPQSAIETAKAVAAARTVDRLHVPDSTPAAGGIVDGLRKNVVVGPHLDGSHVAIFGGQFGDGSGTVKGYDGKGKGTAWTPAHPEDIALVQPYSTIHIASYLDDTHGVRLVYRMGDLDGSPIDLDTVALNPKLAVLVSDQTGESLFPLRFPSVGSGGAAVPLVPTKPAPKPPAPGGTGSGSGGGGVAGGEGSGAGAVGGIGLALGAIAVIALGTILLRGE